MNNNQKNQIKLLKFMAEYIEKQGYPPSIRELTSAVGFSSTNHTRYLMRQLADKGYVSVASRIARGIRILDAGKRFVSLIRGDKYYGRQPI